MKIKSCQFPGVLFLFQSLFTITANADVLQDDFTGRSATKNWSVVGGACLTAGNNAGAIPACVGSSYYTQPACPSTPISPYPCVDPAAYPTSTLYGGATGVLPDPAGRGALRLTSGTPYFWQTGAIISDPARPFSTTKGLSVTFTTVSYQGKTFDYWGSDGIHYGTGNSGADGIGFLLMDADVARPYFISGKPRIGAAGGSLGYACNNVNDNFNGIIGGYLGLGMDEFGNFLNNYDNSATGFGYQPNRIGLRGAGNIAWDWLRTNYPAYYPGGLSTTQRADAVRATCRTGVLWNYSNPSNPVATSISVMDYPAIPGAYSVLPPGVPLSSVNATRRGDAVPVNYQLKLTQDGLLSVSYSYNGGVHQPVITNHPITSANGPIPDNLLFAFTASNGGSTNTHEITCFQAGPADQSTSSAGVNVRQSGEVKTGTQVYLAFYHTDNWWGRLTAQDLVFNASTNSVSVNPVVNWDASCVLTGGTCETSGATGMTAQSPNNRQMLTWNGLQGIPFQWGNLTTGQRSTLTAGDPASSGPRRVMYLRGERTHELGSPGANLFRKRTGVLGDIVHSSPAWVGPPGAPYLSTWSNLIHPTAPMPENATPYTQFINTMKTRQNVVYIGSNDGFLHGFRAGGYNAAGNFVNNSTTPNDGQEVIAFMPNTVLQNIHSTTPAVDFSSTQYAHSYFVDGTSGTGDLFYAGQWHTWLVGGLGSGGKAIYALDVTNPTNFRETNASNLVIGEWSSTTINCVNVSGCGSSLGKTYGTPAIRRFHNGSWGVVFGNGFDSNSGTAGIFIMTVDTTTGAQSIRFLNTGYGPAGGRNNGISFVTPADLDGDHVVDYIYAGDVLGNVWRFDVTSTNPTQWSASTYGTGGPRPLFSTPSGQPISTAVMVISSPSGGSGLPRVIVDFGTGQNIPSTVSTPEQYATGSQNLYGIWDWDMAAWNAFNSVDYASLASPQAVTTTRLQTQTLSGSIVSPTDGTTRFRTVTNNPVCWAGSSTCATGNTQLGWKLTLPESNEQVIFSPIISNGAFIVNTTTPAANNPFACNASLPTGWTIAISPTTGGSFPASFFGDADNNFSNVNGNPVNGIALNATGSPSVVLAQKKPFLINQTSSGVGVANQINPPAGTIGGRVNWIQLR